MASPAEVAGGVPQPSVSPDELNDTRQFTPAEVELIRLRSEGLVTDDLEDFLKGVLDEAQLVVDLKRESDELSKTLRAKSETAERLENDVHKRAATLPLELVARIALEYRKVIGSEDKAPAA